MPATSRTRSGSTRANSTAAAPRSFLLTRISSKRASAARPQASHAVGDVGPGLDSELSGDAVEQVPDAGSERGHADDDHDGDQADEQAVLDGGRAAVLAVLEAAGDEGDQGEQVCVCTGHGGLLE